MRIILFRTYEHLKLYIILRIFHILKTFYIYQTLHSLSNKFKSLLSKFRKVLWYDREDKAVSSFFFDAKFDRQCENGIKQIWTRTWTLEKTDLGPVIIFDKFEGADFKYDNCFLKFQSRNTQIRYFRSQTQAFFIFFHKILH